MENIVVKGGVRVCLHKRKPSLLAPDLKDGELSMMLVPQVDIPGPEGRWLTSANCWVKDHEGRQITFRVHNDTLWELRKALNKLADDGGLTEPTPEKI